MTPPRLAFDHLVHLTTPMGLFEHALGTEPRHEHAYCVDDVARGLVVTARAGSSDPVVQDLARGYLDFLLDAIEPDGLVHNRRRLDGSWSDRASADDHWGRALWALGTATDSGDLVLATRARAGAALLLRARSGWMRSTAYAALGAGHLLRANPDDVSAIRLLEDAQRRLPRAGADAQWPWPEDRLTYANAVLPEAMIVVGDALADQRLRDDGLLLLRWLVDVQTPNGHLSVVPSTGWTRRHHRPGFAQQPIEVAALAEACFAAYASTSDETWRDVIERAVVWFAGENDGGVPMCDPVTGGGFDGLERTGASRNQGAESTLAWLSTVQVADQASRSSRAALLVTTS